MSAFEFLRAFDYPVLKFFNVTLANAYADEFWRTITQLHKLWWMRALVGPAILIGLTYRFRWQALKPLLMVGLAVGLTDVIAYRVVKSAVGRPRPYENAEIAGWVRRAGQSHGSSFPSSHAANSFAGAAVLAWYFADRRRYFYGFAILIGISRLALGVHYPSDVIVGAWLGLLVAFFVTSLLIARVPELRMSTPEAAESGDWRRRFDRPRER